MSNLKYIRKLIEEHNALNTPQVVLDKQNLETEIRAVLENLTSECEPVFKDFADNPLTQVPLEELKANVKNFINLANQNEQVAQNVQMLIGHFNYYFILKCFCDVQNCLKNQNVNLEETFSYQSLFLDITDDVYKIKKDLKISTQDLLAYTYFLAYNEYAKTFSEPMEKYLVKYKPQKHFSSRKNNSTYLINEAKRSYFLQDSLLSLEFKNFEYFYKNHVLNSKI